MANTYNHFKGIPDLPDIPREKTKRPKLMAVVDEDNCTGCQACVPFCPVDCIEPVAKDKYEIVILLFRFVLMNVPVVKFAPVYVLR